MMTTNNLIRLSIITAFVIYGAWVMWHQSFIAIDNQRYFTIADDALISLRYAWNVAHGKGLTWNEGEYVEGITNMLWTIFHAIPAIIFPKRFLPLIIQISGMIFLIITSLNFRSLFVTIAPYHDNYSYYSIYLQAIALLIPLLTMPLVYWSLRGMEISMQSALISGAILLLLKKQPSYWGALLLGLAYLTRPDSIIVIGLCISYRLYRGCQNRLKKLVVLQESVIIVGIIVGITVFRLIYFGDFIPNTYILKVHGMNTIERITLNGIPSMVPFLKFWRLLWVFCALSLSIHYTQTKLLLFLIPIAMFIYTVYIGGDAFPHDRFMASFMPYTSLVLLTNVPPIFHWISHQIRRYIPTKSFVNLKLDIGIMFFLIFVYCYLCFPYSQISRLYYDFQRPQKDDQENINTAIFLNTSLKRGASVGVFYAGSIPFYTDYYAYDFLGKSDTYIAHLAPDKSGAISWNNLASVPGHNKYDLNYSIKTRLPTYIQASQWGRQDLTEFVILVYAVIPLSFDTCSWPDKRKIFLLKHSDMVLWETLPIP